MRNLRKCIAFIMAMIMVMMIQENAFVMQSNAQTTDGIIQLSGTCDYVSAYEVLDKLNEERTNAGLAELAMDQDLLDAAMLRAAEVTIRFSHTRPNDTVCFTASNHMSGENIAAGQQNAESVMTAWMGSDGHRENILKSDYKSVGIGCFYKDGIRYWVQCFGRSEAIAAVSMTNCEVIYPLNVNLDLFTFTATDSIVNMNMGEKKAVYINLSSANILKPVRVLNQTFTWESSNPQTVSVMNGELTALASGTAYITASLGSQKVNITAVVSEADTTQEPSSETTTESPFHQWYGTEDNASSMGTTQEPSQTAFSTQTSYGQDGASDATTEEPDIDMSKVTLAKTEVTGYLFSQYVYEGTASYSPAQIAIKINSDTVLDEQAMNLSVTCQSTKKKVSVAASVSNNELLISAYCKKSADTTVKVRINGKLYKIKLHLKTATISDSSCLLVKGKTKKLKIKGYSKKVKWTSINKNIATVSSKGVVKGKRIGNVIITAQIGDQYVGCAVSVTTNSLKKVCERARYMGKNWTYSQAKRTLNGYYDCSALVWKAYKMHAKTTFGSPSYPSVALNEAKWCKANGRMVKGGFSVKNLNQMKVNPGDLLFKSTNPKKPYDDIYHVEMFTGYICMGYYDGVPVIGTLWAARGVNYAYPDGQLLGRPVKQ